MLVARTRAARASGRRCAVRFADESNVSRIPRRSARSEGRIDRRAVSDGCGHHLVHRAERIGPGRGRLALGDEGLGLKPTRPPGS